MQPAALETAAQRVKQALSGLSRATPPEELARVVDLHALVRNSAADRRESIAAEIARVSDGRARLARLTRPEEGAGGLDVRA